MISELKPQNFRCFSDHTVPFKRTSIVIGRNNAGKSTLVEALRLVVIVASRYKSLSYHNPTDLHDIPRREVGVSPSSKSYKFNFRSVLHRYSDPPAIITAIFDSRLLDRRKGGLTPTVIQGTSLVIYLFEGR